MNIKNINLSFRIQPFSSELQRFQITFIFALVLTSSAGELAVLQLLCKQQTASLNKRPHNKYLLFQFQMTFY